MIEIIQISWALTKMDYAGPGRLIDKDRRRRICAGCHRGRRSREEMALAIKMPADK